MIKDYEIIKHAAIMKYFGLKPLIILVFMLAPFAKREGFKQQISFFLLPSEQKLVFNIFKLPI